MRTVACLWILVLAGCFDVPALPPGDQSPSDCTDCSNDAFCDGIERCEDGVCLQGSSPCAPDQRCDEASDQCLPAADVGIRVDGGPTDCCDGVTPIACQAARCVAETCIFDAADEGAPCDGNHECRAGQCVRPCDEFSDCDAPPGDCMRATCNDGVCGVADCPGDVCRPDGCPRCDDDGGGCGAAPPCQRTECLEGVCATFFDAGAACDDGAPCFEDDRCDAAGTCQPGNVPLCDQGEMCSPQSNRCLAPPECMSENDCQDSRPFCTSDQCVQCRNADDCAIQDSRICSDGQCVCTADDDCTHLNDAACTFANDCAPTGSIQRGRCVGRQCQAQPDLALCQRETDGEPCDQLASICLDAECLPAMAQVTVECPNPLARVRVDCGNNVLVDAVCDGGSTVVECPRGDVLTACCSSDLLNTCSVPPADQAIAPHNVHLSVDPGLDEPECSGPMVGTHRECSGEIHFDPTIRCEIR